MSPRSNRLVWFLTLRFLFVLSVLFALPGGQDKADVSMFAVDASDFGVWRSLRLEFVDRHLEEDISLFISFRHLTGAHVHLQRGDDELGHVQRGIPAIAHFDEGVFVFARADMDICGFLFAHGCFPGVFIASRSFVVVADEDAGFVGQGKDF